MTVLKPITELGRDGDSLTSFLRLDVCVTWFGEDLKSRAGRQPVFFFSEWQLVPIFPFLHLKECDFDTRTLVRLLSH